MNRVVLPDLEAFVAAAREAGIRRVVLRVIAEVRPRHFEGGRVEVAPQRWCELVTYDAGAATLDDADGDAVEAALKDAGLAVRRVSGNLT
jgi:hypothetical protein